MVNRRGTLVWAMAMLFAMFVMLAAGQWAVLSAAALLTLFLFAYGALNGNFSPQIVGDRMLDALPMSKPSVTDSARKARMQASRRADFDTANYTLKDVGLVVEEPSVKGLSLRQARLISMDDEAARPYAQVYAPRQAHPRQTLVRYEIADAAGQVQFVCEMDHWMRPGENTLIPNYRLPLRGNTQLNRVGTWDLHVWINGGLIGIHHFSVSPSVTERRRQFGLDGEAQIPVKLENDTAPVALDDLLAQQRSRSAR